MPKSDPLTPEQRAIQGRIGAHVSWSRTVDASARTAPARRAALERFYDEVDPDRILPEPERERRAGHARKAHMARLALASAKARRKGAVDAAA